MSTTSSASCCLPNNNNNKNNNKQTQSKEKKYETPKVVAMNENSKYIDSHVHVDQILIRLNKMLTDFPQFQKENYPAQFESCIQVCCDPISLEYTDLLVGFDPIYAAYGVHPHNASQYNDDVEGKLLKRMEHPKTVAWGEIGLDYFYTKSPRDVQQTSLARQLKMAVICGKPIVIHTREAEEDTLRILKENVPKEWKIHIHCFTSSLQFAQSLLDYYPNLCIGFTGCITFKNSGAYRETIAQIPLERLLLETDGPYMTPEPFRGQVAHSGHIPMVANMIAQVKNISIDQVFQQCRINTRNIYGI
eukprot:gene10772-13190_t